MNQTISFLTSSFKQLSIYSMTLIPVSHKFFPSAVILNTYSVSPRITLETQLRDSGAGQINSSSFSLISPIIRFRISTLTIIWLTIDCIHHFLRIFRSNANSCNVEVYQILFTRRSFLAVSFPINFTILSEN